VSLPHVLGVGFANLFPVWSVGVLICDIVVSSRTRFADVGFVFISMCGSVVGFGL
jgi:hypothetical protein